MTGPLLLTGASGWFGRTALHAYELAYGPEALRRDVIPFASRPSQVDFGSAHGPIQALPLETISTYPAPSGLLHLAFLTRDKVKTMGWQRYVNLNRDITATVLAVLKANPDLPVVALSSGAAQDAENQDGASLLQSNPYAVLKHQEEQALEQIASTRLAVVFRVFAASGRFMTRPEKFALGDFLMHGLEGRPIVVQNPALVMRSYIHADTLMRASWRLIRGRCEHGLQTPGFHRIDACTHTVRLTDLARFIAKQFNVPCLTPSHNHEREQQDLYIGDPLPMTALLRKLQLPACDLQEQIADTCIGLRRAA